jgi:hypothetical protein
MQRATASRTASLVLTWLCVLCVCVGSTVCAVALVGFGLRSDDLLTIFAGVAYMSTGSFLLLKVVPAMQMHYVGRVDGLNIPALFATQWISALLGYSTIMAFYAPQQRKLFEHSIIKLADGGLDESRTHSVECAVCLQEAAAVAFLPCGHLAVCMTCSSELGFIVGERPLSHDRCPICRASVAAWVRIYT